MASETETWRRWKACSGRVLAAGVTTKVGWVFRGEGCTSLLERRTELKGWEAGITLAFPKRINCITEFRDSWYPGISSSGPCVVRWACSRTCWVLTPSESVTPGLGVVVVINWKMIQKCAVTISWATYWVTPGGKDQSSLRSCYHPPPWPAGLHLQQGAKFLVPPQQKDRRRLGNRRGFSWRAAKMFCDLQQMFWDLWGEAEETGRVVFVQQRRLRF